MVGISTHDVNQIRGLFQKASWEAIAKDATKQELREMYQTVVFRYAKRHWNKRQLAQDIACALGALLR